MIFKIISLVFCILYSTSTFSQTNILISAKAQKQSNDMLLEVKANVYTFMGSTALWGYNVVTSADTQIVKNYYEIPIIGGGLLGNNVFVDTINLGIIPSSVKLIRVEMYTIQHVDTIPDTVYEAPSITLFLPLSVAGVSHEVVGVNIYPNPHKGIFTLDVPHAGSTITDLEILNSVGQLVYHEHLAPAYGTIKKEIVMGDAPPGVYLLRLQTGKGVLTKRFTIQ